ncbi:MAG: Leader peptidase (Prepilin peptidase) / N-methyltransferase [Pseudonocardiales bacterium]|nr:Leader peptidase (Prepilin peptidase) / N-methyltransferase [Pseudonocardiales bacterium]
MPFLIVVVILLGLAIGSFLNVVIYRVPMGASLSHPSSHCPSCDHPIRNRHNIPALGWVLLRGRCADCRTPISLRYPVIELLTAALFAATTIRLGQLHLLPALPAYLYFGAMGVCLTAIDIDVQRLPNAIVLPSYPIVAILLAIAAVNQHDLSALLRSGIAAAALFIIYFALAFAYPAGMGLGDVKLAGIVGGVMGYISYQVFLVGAFAAFFLGSIIGVLVMLTRRGSRKSTVPFGPFMIVGALLALFAGAPIADLYTQVILHA